MHKSSYEKMTAFRREYLTGREDEPLRIMDLGSMEVKEGGSYNYKNIFASPAWQYIGVDMEPGENVDVVTADPYDWKDIKGDSVDVVISGQAFEHIEFFWLTMIEIARVLKPGGLCCIIAPSCGPEHKHPVDCWRFYPDGFRALARFARLNVLKAATQWKGEGYKDGSDEWRDSVLVCRKPLDGSSLKTTGKNQKKSMEQKLLIQSAGEKELANIHFNPLKHARSVFGEPRFVSDQSAWVEHIPFAFTLIDFLRPRVLVELGTHCGDSYLAFCQAVEALGVDCKCYAVDTWEGDPHAGTYGPEVLDALKQRHDPCYRRFSELIQATFDEALKRFKDNSIDLLHIDGYHLYNATRHDFEAWLPKMSDRGIILFHDTNIFAHNFGVWKLWEELKGRYPYFEFRHGHGLGMIAVGSVVPAGVKEFFTAGPEAASIIAELFFKLGERFSLRQTVEKQSRVIAEKDEQIAEMGKKIAERNRWITEKDQTIDDKNHLLSEMSQRITVMGKKIADKDRLLAERGQEITQKHHLLAKTGQEIAEKDRWLKQMDQQITQKDRRLAEMKRQIAEKEAGMQAILNSWSWKITGPMRKTLSLLPGKKG